MMKLMKVVAAVCMLSMVSTGVFAQDETEITDDQLYRYAIMQEVINLMKKDISAEVNKIIKAPFTLSGVFL
jgi:type II secretory pathway component PulJ